MVLFLFIFILFYNTIIFSLTPYFILFCPSSSLIPYFTYLILALIWISSLISNINLSCNSLPLSFRIVNLSSGKQEQPNIFALIYLSCIIIPIKLNLCDFIINSIPIFHTMNYNFVFRSCWDCWYMKTTTNLPYLIKITIYDSLYLNSTLSAKQKDS